MGWLLVVPLCSKGFVREAVGKMCERQSVVIPSISLEACCLPEGSHFLILGLVDKGAGVNGPKWNLRM